MLGWVDDRILSGEVRVGDRLPPERGTRQLLDVSRPAVREAVRTLQAQGVVHSAVGAGATGGTTIRAVPTDALTRLLARWTSRWPTSPCPMSSRSASPWSGSASASRRPMRRQGTWRQCGASSTRCPIPGSSESVQRLRHGVPRALAAAAGNPLAPDLTVAIRESLRLPILDRFRALDSWHDVVAGSGAITRRSMPPSPVVTPTRRSDSWSRTSGGLGAASTRRARRGLRSRDVHLDVARPENPTDPGGLGPAPRG